MKNKRRNFLIGSGVVAAAISAIGYKDTIKYAATFKSKGKKAKNSIYGNACKTAFSIDNNGDVKINDDFLILPSVCNACTTFCSIRAKIDKKTNKVERVFGNPYSLLSSDPWLPMDTPLLDSFKELSNYKEKGLNLRSTCCARGNVVFSKLNDEFRVTTPLKRVGKRGENRWKSISIEELIKEIVNGGNLFDEGEVKGLKSFCDTKTLIDKNNPEYGPIANKLCVIGTTDEGRETFMIDRFVQGFGSINYIGHTGICGLSMRSGEAAYLNDFDTYPHIFPDFKHCKYLLSIATAPAQAGNPFKRKARLLCEARTKDDFKYTTITPILTNADTFALNNRSNWIPIKPGGDLALVMGMLYEIIDKNLYNSSYLQIPSLKSQNKLKDVSHTNATYLIIQEGDDKNKFLRDENGNFLVIDTVDNKVKKADDVLQATLFFEGEIEYLGKKFLVKTSFSQLKRNIFEHSLEDYSKDSGVEIDTIKQLAKEFTSHGRAVAIDCHGGTMHTTGFYTTYAIMLLGAMVGNLNYKGGMSAGGGKFKSFDGTKYNLLDYEGKIKPYGVKIDRTRSFYEQSSEFKRKIQNDQNPYPAKDKWYPYTKSLENEVITSSANNYPYRLDALITWGANFIYGQSGSPFLLELIKDPKKSIPLFIAIDPFINETSKYADYIVPDSVLYETWGTLGPWGSYNVKTSHLRYPILPSPNAKFKNGESITMDSFIIELGKALNLKSFGKDAISDKDGNKYDLNKPEDFYLRAFENIALDGDGVKDISDEEFRLVNLEPFKKSLQKICKQNWRKVAFIMSRGGRFSSASSAYKGDMLRNSYKKTIAIYNENIGTLKNSLDGKEYSGCIKYYKARYSNGELLPIKGGYNLLAFSYKSNVFSSPSATLQKLKEIKYSTYISINSKTAKDNNIKNGDKIKVSSYDNFIIGIAKIKEGVYPEAIGVEHGGGRRAEGAINLIIDDKILKARIRRRTGVFYNKLGLKDPTRLGVATLGDFVIGSNVRQAIPVKIEKI